MAIERTKFHEKAVFIYAAEQIAEGQSAVTALSTKGKYSRNATTDTATITSATGETGSFAAEVPKGVYVTTKYNGKTITLGRVSAVAPTTITLEDAYVPITTAESTALNTSRYFATALGPRNKVAALNLNFSIDLTSEAYQYAGDELDRDELTVITDKLGKFDFETFTPILKTKYTTADLFYSSFFKACGFTVSNPTEDVGSIAYSKIVQVTNTSTASNTYLTVEIHRASPDMPTEDKIYYITDVRGTLDFDSVVGTRPKLKWNMMGNFKGIQDNAKRVETTTDISVYEDMKSSISSVVSSESITSAMLTDLSGISYKVNLGTKDTAVSGTTYNIAGLRYKVGTASGRSTNTALVTDLIEASKLIEANPSITLDDLNSIMNLSGDESGKFLSVTLADSYGITQDTALSPTEIGIWLKPVSGYEGRSNLSFYTEDSSVLKSTNLTSKATSADPKVYSVTLPTSIDNIESITIAGLTFKIGPATKEGDLAAIFEKASAALNAPTGKPTTADALNKYASGDTPTLATLLTGDTKGAFTNIALTPLYTIARGTAKSTTALDFTTKAGTVFSGPRIIELVVSQNTSPTPIAANSFTQTHVAVGRKRLVNTRLSTYPSEYQPIKNVCFDKVTFPNIAGFEFNRYKTGCGDGWSKGAVPTDVNMTILEDAAGAAFNPYRTIENFYDLWFGFKSGASQVIINNNKMQLTNVAQSTVANFVGQDLTFRNVGKTTIYFVGY